jgi:hypothetical protein
MAIDRTNHKAAGDVVARPDEPRAWLEFGSATEDNLIGSSAPAWAAADDITGDDITGVGGDTVDNDGSGSDLTGFATVTAVARTHWSGPWADVDADTVINTGFQNNGTFSQFEPATSLDPAGATVWDDTDIVHATPDTDQDPGFFEDMMEGTQI